MPPGFTARAQMRTSRPLLRLSKHCRRAASGLLAAGAALALQTPAWADDTELLREAAQLADRVVQPKLNFAPCAVNATLDCGTLRVPVDYRKPWAGQVDLAVIRARATRPGRRIGVLYGNPGGPADSGFDFVRLGVDLPAFQRLRERFDIIGFDVRGTHRSQAVRCEAALPANTPAAVDEFSKQLAQNCLQQHGPLITSMSTNNSARDLDLLRRSLGEQQITLFGVSYGGTLGAVYATLFPRQLRAMLLDAPAHPNHHDGFVEFWLEQAASFELTFQHLDQRCRADAVCRLRTAGVGSTLAALNAHLAQTPITGPGGVVLTASRVRGALLPLLSRESSWPLVVDALADATTGNFALLFQLVGSSGGPAGSPGTLSMTPQTIMFCNDYRTRRKAAEVQSLADASGAVSSRMSDPLTIRVQAAKCAGWPAAEIPLIRPLARSLATPATPALPTLLLGANFDSNTPLSWARNLADRLRAEGNVVRYQGGGHGSYGASGNTCIDAVGDAFLVDLVVPPNGTSCAARPINFRPPAGATTEAMARSRVQELEQTRAFAPKGL